MIMIISIIIIVLFQIIGNVLCSTSIISLTDFQLISSDYYPNANSSPPPLNSTHLFNVKVPCTIVQCLIDAKQLPDNLLLSKHLLGVDKSRFNVSWWFITTFETPKNEQFQKLLFKGVSYKANLFLNSKQLATVDSMQGSFVYHEFDVSNYLFRNNSLNTLKIQVSYVIVR
jgi:hypothetical protein